MLRSPWSKIFYVPLVLDLLGWVIFHSWITENDDKTAVSSDVEAVWRI